jgi:hypothetical protein
MTMRNPFHPGLSVQQDCIEPLGLTITEAANILGGCVLWSAFSGSITTKVEPKWT